MSAPIVLVPGWWLGAWAWDEVATLLRAAGHEVTPLTLPGLESVEADRANVTFDDQVQAIVAAVRSAGRGGKVVLATHSGAGAPGYAATDVVPELIATAVYVDTGPAIGPLDADFEGVEKPLPPADELAASENLDGISDEQLAEFRRRAVPEPAGAIRGAATLSNPARLDVPTVAICTAFSSADYKEAIAQGHAFLAGYGELTDITWIDLPTSHWPMWSKPRELAQIISEVAARH